ncbi:MAG: hypothetical protein HYU52_15595 [Acidobacteria bacterium]|nr:hypothetical protein [Acidobacteriota bacterium]
MGARLIRRLAAILIALPCTAQELPFVHFTPDHGPVRLPSSSVQVVRQDHIGYVWLGFFSKAVGSEPQFKVFGVRRL